MDFNHKQTSANAGPNEPTNETVHGSANLKHQRSGLAEESWNLNKMQRTNEVDFSSKKNYTEGFGVFGRSNLWQSGVDDGQKMLSFSSSEPHYNGGMIDNRSIGFSVLQNGNHCKTRGVFNEVMQGPFARMKGPFTPSQWMELEHQALIYKHLVSNVPIPSNLLIPLKRSLYSYGSSGSYASNFLGWGPFHLGYSGSNDPEPGRCRRTDGKKWRCSRDAVPDQKYCERHINRGRHRSRKPVEGHTGQAVSGSTTSKVETAVSSSSAALISSSKSIGAMQHQFNSLQSSTGNASTDQLASRTQGFQGLGLTDPKPKGATFSNQKQHVPYEESSLSLFGLVSSDSLVNPSERISFINTKNTDSFMGFNDKEANNQYPVHHFIDDWPKNNSDHNSASWGEELRSDWTQLSMSIPVAPDFSSSANSPTREKSMIPTLKLSHDIDPTRMSLGSWGSPMGGPLGEVLTSTTSNAGSLSSPNEWNNSPPIGSSPTGVLQKSTFVSLSNSSSGGSPPSSDKVTPDAATLCNALGSALVSSTAIPSL